jgi:hypothetical protein
MGRQRGMLQLQSVIFKVSVKLVVTCRFSLNSVFWVWGGGAACRDDWGGHMRTPPQKSPIFELENFPADKLLSSSA